MSTEANYWVRANRRFGRRRLIVGAAIGGVGLAGIGLAGCGDSSKPGSESGGSQGEAATSKLTAPADTTQQATRGMIVPQYTVANPPHLDIQQDASAPVISTVGLVYDTLLEPVPGRLAPPTGEVQGALADRYELAEPTRLVLHLRQNAKFDPRPPTSSRAIEAEDVLVSWEQFKNRNTYRREFNAALSELAPVAGIEAPDAKTIVIKLARPDSTLLGRLASKNYYFYVTPKEAFGGPNSFDVRQEARGTGPYMLTQFQSNVQATYRRNPNYWRADRPLIDGFDNYIITEYAQQLAQFTAGKIWNTPVSQADLLDVKGQVPALELRESDLPLASNRLWLGVRPDSVFRDPRVRRAASMLIDRKLLQDTFYSVPTFEKSGYPVKRYMPTIGVAPYYQGIWLNPESDDYTAEQKKTFEFHPDEAKKLLEAAGVKTPVELNFGYSKGRYGDTHERTAEAMANMLGAQGLFKMNLTHIDYTTDWIPKFVGGQGNAAFPFFTPNANFGAPGALKYLLGYFHHTGSLQNAAMNGGPPVPGQDQSEAMLEKALATLDLKEQTSILKDWQRFMAMHCICVDDPGAGVTPFKLNWPWVMNVDVWKGNTDVDVIERWIDKKKLQELGYS